MAKSQAMRGTPAIRSNLAAHGFLPVAVAGKRPVMDGWQKAVPTADEIAGWASLYPRATNTGIVTRSHPAIDIDIESPEAAELIEALARAQFEGRILVRTGRPPRRAIILRTDAPFSKMVLLLDGPDGSEHKVEILGNGQQLVVHGTHPDTGADYTWNGSGSPWTVDAAELPPIDEMQARAFLAEAQAMLGALGFKVKSEPRPKSNGADHDPPPEHIRASSGTGRGTATEKPDIEEIRLALAAIPGNSSEAVWHECGCALHKEFGEDGFALFQEWSKTSEKYTSRGCRKKWKNCARFDAYTAGTIFHYADEATPGWRDPVPSDEPEPEPTSAPPSESGLGVWNAGDDTEMPPPRGWLLGNVFCRGFVSSLLGSGGTGKTALRYAQALSLATRRALTGEHVFQRARVLIVSLEDDDRELKRRIRAARLHHQITLADVNDWLFLCAPGRKAGKLMTTDARGRLVEGDLGAKITTEIIAHRIDLVMIDPFVKAHSVEENANSAIDDVMQVLTDLAADRDVAVDTPHHTSKGAGDPGNADKGRGASAMANALRLVNTATEMATLEAAAFGIAEADRRLYLRIDSAKVNITRHSGAAQWFRLVGVAIGNATAIYPHGDNVQTVEPWWPPDTWAGVGDGQINTILDEIDAGLADGNRYGDAPNLTDRAAWRVVKKNCPDKTEQQAREIVKAWIKGGRLVNREYQNPVTFKQVKGLYKQLPLR